jgi:hypothetical protein
MTKRVTNFAASVKTRLLDATRKQGDFQRTLQRYVAERFLYRLGVSTHREKFVVKGAMLFVLWEGAPLRPTKDLDLAGYWENDAASLEAAFREILSIPCPSDGIVPALETLEITPIRDASEYHGFRVTLDVRLHTAVVPFQVDVGFGDAIVPGPLDVVFPVLLDAEPPRVRAYPREVAVAEKLHAMVWLAEANTRLKDFYDVHALCSRFAFAGPTLVGAIAATFERRKSATLDPWPIALTTGFYADATRHDHWGRFVRRSKLEDAPGDFARVGERILNFFETPVRRLAKGVVIDSKWEPGGPWR